jgi:hypothetical protein
MVLYLHCRLCGSVLLVNQSSKPLTQSRQLSTPRSQCGIRVTFQPHPVPSQFQQSFIKKIFRLSKNLGVGRC